MLEMKRRKSLEYATRATKVRRLSNVSVNSSLGGENAISKTPSTIDTTSTVGLAAARAIAAQQQIRRNSFGSSLPQTVVQGGRRNSLEVIRSIEFARRMSLEGATKAAVAAKKIL